MTASAKIDITMARLMTIPNKIGNRAEYNKLLTAAEKIAQKGEAKLTARELAWVKKVAPKLEYYEDNVLKESIY